MLRDGLEVSIDVVPFDSTQRTYVVKDGVTYKIDDGTSVIYGGVSGIMKGYRVFLGVDNVQVTLEEGDSLTIKDNKYFSGVETVTTVYTTPTNDIDVTYNAIDIQRMNASLGSGFLDIATNDITVSGMTVTIQPQRACIDGITVNAKESVQLAIDNGLSQLRTDLIVLRKTQSSASADYFVKKGELGSTTPPALEQVAMGIYEVPVCSIRVNANQTTLELSNITDLRNYLTRERDKPVEDTGTGINPLQSSTFVLTNSSTTRTISNGLWVGQTVKLFNSTANTITVTDGSFTFTVLTDNKKTVTWNGTRWDSVGNFRESEIETLNVSTKITVPEPVEETNATSKFYVDERTNHVCIAGKESDANGTYIYSELLVSNITSEQRIVIPNPFGNSTPVVCVAEVFFNNRWSETGFIYSNQTGSGYGTLANYVQGEGVVIQSGGFIVAPSSDGGGGHGANTNASSAPCRVHVWKIGESI